MCGSICKWICGRMMGRYMSVWMGRCRVDGWVNGLMFGRVDGKAD